MLKIHNTVTYLAPNYIQSSCLNRYLRLNTVELPDWKKTIRIMLKEDGFFDGQTFRYIDGRQTGIFTIPRRLEYVK